MKHFHIAICFITTAVVAGPALGQDPTLNRYIRGAADPHAQIVVVNEVTGDLSGYVASGSGTYVAGPLAPGRYTIYEDQPRHAKRHLTVDGSHDGEVDL